MKIKLFNFLLIIFLAPVISTRALYATDVFPRYEVDECHKHTNYQKIEQKKEMPEADTASNFNLKNILILWKKSNANIIVPDNFTTEHVLDYRAVYLHEDEDKIKIAISYKLEDKIYNTEDYTLACLYAITSIYAGNDHSAFLSSIMDNDIDLVNEITLSDENKLKDFLSRMEDALPW